MIKPDEKKALALMQQIRAIRLLGGRRRAKSGRRDIRVWRRRGRMVRMIGRGNQDCGMEEYKQEADMEDGRGYSGVGSFVGGGRFEVACISWLYG